MADIPKSDRVQLRFQILQDLVPIHNDNPKAGDTTSYLRSLDDRIADARKIEAYLYEVISNV